MLGSPPPNLPERLSFSVSLSGAACFRFDRGPFQDPGGFPTIEAADPSQGSPCSFFSSDGSSM